MKRCPKCSQTKPHAEFYTLKNGNPSGWCKQCVNADQRQRYEDPEWAEKRKAYRREWGQNPENKRKRRAKAYSLTLEQYDEKVASQGGRCAICGDEAALQVDHDHTCCATEASSCGECNRDMLCPSCNVGISRFQDDPERLIAAAKYLRKWKRAYV